MTINTRGRATVINATEVGEAPAPVIIRKRGMRKELARGRVFSHGKTLVQPDQPMYYVFSVADEDQKQVTVALHPDTLKALLAGWEYVP